MNTFVRTLRSLKLPTAAAALTLLALPASQVHGQVPLADQPVFTNTTVPGNMALALSVEFPTAVSVAHTDSSYNTTKVYQGYFDPNKCYLYNYSTTEAQRYFYPAGLASSLACTGGDDSKWSGNFLNWLTMQTIDPFRWALTGGYRVVDTATDTQLEKAWASGQGGAGNFPDRSISTTSIVANATPFNWTSMKVRIQGLGNKMRFTQSGDNNSGTPTDYDPGSSVAISGSTVYEVSVRVRVCDTSAAAGGLEPNCTAYPAGNYKPEGLMQQYSNIFRFSAFGYLNDGNLQRDGGVLRARQKFVAPMMPRPGSTDIANPKAEWDSNTGVMLVNPDSADATDTTTIFGVAVANSGVLNYLNKFGQITPGSYKTYDPVGELYYAALRYYKNLGNVPEWTSMTGASTATKTTWIDGFPVITNWDDPIQYWCQRNMILGIGDVNTHADKNVPGNAGSSNEPTKPAAVTADTSVNAVTATNKLGVLHGLGSSLGTQENYGGCCNNNSALMAGLAFDANTLDIRPDDASKPQTAGKQTVQTYWLDILEYQTYKKNNQYYLAAKYGGFKAPNTFNPYTQTADIPTNWWTTNNQTVGSGSDAQARPDNYFVASQPDSMVSGLRAAFAKASSDLKSYTTSFATTLPQVALSGTASYGAQYDAGTWTGDVRANDVSFDATTGAPTLTPQWSFSNKLATQISGTGWDTGRRIVTWNTNTNAAVPFRYTSLSTAQQNALDTIYRSGNDGSDFLNYLRGDPTHEESSAATTSSHMYRNRTDPVGDIVGSRLRPVGKPSATYSDAANPGYSTFKSTWTNRATMLYVGTNAGLLHAINGATTGSGGQEVFAYVPGDMYLGPSGSPGVDGLVARGDPNFTHKPMVDGPPVVYDIDLGRTMDNAGTTLGNTTNWKSVLVGSLGKGGKSYFAIDVTDPSVMTTETAVAGKVLWEFRHTDLGFTFGAPSAVKTRKWGWVLVFGSGYNNTDGKGYFFFVNPRNGALLEKVSTGAGSTSSQAGLAHVQPYVLDRTDGTAESIYAGDLLGNLWRLDVTPASGAYAAPVKLAELRNANNQALPVTSRPLVVVHPRLNRRFITVGTGRLLHSTDVNSTQKQVFAAILDGTGSAMGTSAGLPSGVTYPIQMSNLQQVTDFTQPMALNFSTDSGWWADMGQGANNLGWRVITDPTSFFGIVTWVSMLPNGDACSPAGTSRVYSVDVGTAESQLVDSNNNNMAYSTAMPSVVIDQGTYSVNGVPRLLVGDDGGRTGILKRRTPSGMGLRRLNWRELPVAD
jgi:type IV pilus assembly protein PilY1